MQQALLSGPAEPDAWVEASARTLKSDPYSRVGLIELEQQLCYLKYYRAKSPLQKLWFRMGRGRAVAAYDAALALAANAVPVPEPRACLQVPGGSLLLTEGLRGSTDLKALWLQSPAEAAGGRLLQCAGETIARLHRAGFAHGDCKWSNLLWQGETLFLADLEAVASVAPGSAKQARDLARFTVNAEDLGVGEGDYERFLASYLEATGVTRDALLALVRPPLAELRGRHLQKYGERGARLI